MKESTTSKVEIEKTLLLQWLPEVDLFGFLILLFTALASNYLFSIASPGGHSGIEYEVGSIARSTVVSPITVRGEAEEDDIVKRGEVIARRGDRISTTQAEKLSELASKHSAQGIFGASFVRFLIVMLTFYLLFTFARYAWRDFRPKKKDLTVLSLSVVGSALLLAVFSVLGKSLSFYNADVSSLSFLLAAPFAGWAILLRLTLNFASVFIFIASFALMTALFVDQSATLSLVIFLGGIVGALGVKKWSRRSAFIKASGRIALINVALVIGIAALSFDWTWTDLVFRIVFAASGGLLSGVLATLLSPVAESIGSYITDIKLLELSSLDHPLLRELSTQAPGTWNHSMVMGQLGESAAEAIGANSLLVRVGAYYHDVGKSTKPDYFVENQKGKSNRHDKLTPSMSALIIKSHVKDGIEMARKHRLPEAIIDFIPEHHGTSRIEFFYDKAKKEAVEGEKVDEEHYRYPGPKPQTKETAILMLADSVESASRTLSEPTPAKIQGLVQKIINKVFASGQLEESELTLKDLHHIAKEFTRVLSGIHHKRIEYSEPAEKRSAKQEGVQAASGEKSEEMSTKGTNEHRSSGKEKREEDADEASGDKKDKKDGGDTLKRLGI